MSFHCKLMLFVSDGQIFLSIMVFLQNFILLAVSGIAELFHVKQFSRKTKRVMAGASYALGVRNAELCFICGVAIGFFMLNWLFIVGKTFCRFLFHVKQRLKYMCFMRQERSESMKP